MHGQSMEDKFIQTSSGRMHARVAGSGTPVLLIHGRNPELNSWRTWEKNIDALAAQSRVYALDLLGYGESDKPEPILDTRGQAQTIVSLLAAESIQRAHLVGLSWGGMIAQVALGLAPEQVDRLVLVDSGYDASQAGIARLNKIRTPTLVLWDESDTVIPVAGARFLGSAIPNSKVRILSERERDPDADPANRHWSQMTHSAQWNQAVLEFLAQGK